MRPRNERAVDTIADDNFRLITSMRLRVCNCGLEAEWKVSYLDGSADETDIEASATSRGESFRLF